MKADDISVLHVAPLVYWCSYMVVFNARSRPQLQAVIAKMEREAEDHWGRSIEEDAKTSRSISGIVTAVLNSAVRSFVLLVQICMLISSRSFEEPLS